MSLASTVLLDLHAATYVPDSAVPIDLSEQQAIAKVVVRRLEGCRGVLERPKMRSRQSNTLDEYEEISCSISIEH